MDISLGEFYIKMVEKLSVLNDEGVSKDNFLSDICTYFDISHAFIYESNYKGEFEKKEYFETTKDNHLQDNIDIKLQLGLEIFSELCSRKVVINSCDSIWNELDEKISGVFNFNTLVLIPILNQHFELAAFVGVGDRRKKARHASAEINNVCSLLNLLANNVKLEMFKKGMANTEAALSNVLDHIGIDIYVNDYYTHDILYTNKSMAAPYGGIENMIGKKCWQAIFDDKTEPCEFCPQPRLLDENGNLSKTYEWDYERPFDKSWFRVLSSSFPWTDGRIAHLVASIDITESKRNQLLIEKLAQFDYLTGLPNRRSLHDDIQMFSTDHTKFAESWYVLFCDLDGFKSVNDTLGHDAGDVLLKGIASELQKMSNDELKAYRQGGDEFVIILKDQNSVEYLKNVIDDLFKVFRKKYIYKGNKMGCDCSIGVANFPFDADDSKKILILADMAMYRVKKEGRGTVRFYKNDKFITMEEYFE